jgi:hypothetical protein
MDVDSSLRSLPHLGTQGIGLAPEHCIRNGFLNLRSTNSSALSFEPCVGRFKATLIGKVDARAARQAGIAQVPAAARQEVGGSSPAAQQQFRLCILNFTYAVANRDNALPPYGPFPGYAISSVSLR